MRESNQDLEQRMKDKEVESRQRVESMRTQAVFSVGYKRSGQT